MTIAVRDFTSAAELRRHNALIRRKLHAQYLPKADPVPAPEPEPVVLLPPADPVEVERDILILTTPPAGDDDGAETPAEREHRMEAVSRARRIVKLVAAKHGVEVGALMGNRRLRVVTDARHEAIVRISEANPHWSLMRIGRFFDRDHTTILHVIRKHRERTARPASSSLSESFHA